MLKKDEDEVAKTLRDVGVDYYTHRNESLIAENAVEGERIKVLIEVRCLVRHNDPEVIFTSYRVAKEKGVEGH